uniref:LRAT domain-containing protein n=1 Tax=Pundamilia nyererei TaxID=303518 RepID=A0A3B4F6J3_9CICH
LSSFDSGRRPQRGDLIEIFRGSYQHWAVYVGDGSVVHLVFILHVFAGFNSIAVITQRGVVREENLRAVVGNDQWQINNSLDSTHNPRPADVIVKEARSWVGREITYHSIRRNYALTALSLCHRAKIKGKLSNFL